MRHPILFISSNFPPVIGGSAVVYEQICSRLANDVVALGSRISLSGMRWENVAEADAKRPYKISRIQCLQPMPSGVRGGKLRLLVERLTVDLPIMARTLLSIVRLLVRYRVKVVCLGELVGLGWLVFPLRYLFGRRVVLYTHGEEITQENDWAMNRMRGVFLRRAHAIVSVSRFCKGEIASRFGVIPGRIHVISNGVDLNLFSPGPAELTCLPEIARKSRVILSVGRLVERKGQEQLIKALPEIFRHEPNAYCLIVGDGPLKPRLLELTRELDIRERCSIMSGVSRETLRDFYRSCDVFVLPCHTLPDGDTEGFGLVFLEANACGAPVVAGMAGGTIEAVNDGYSGLLTDGADPEAIAKSVLRILSNEQFARELSVGGLKWAAQYGWQASADAFLDVCRTGGSGRVEAFESNSIKTIGDREFQTRPPGLLVTMDVEEQFSWNAFRKDGYSVAGVEALKEFQESCGRIGVKPAYMLSWPVLNDREYVSVLSKFFDANVCDIGIHLHSWVTPPFWEEPNVFTSYQCNLPMHVERRKLESLVQRFEDVFERRPLIHRAGRWGGDSRSTELLSDLGILVDLSPVARFTDELGIAPTFDNLDGRPFWAGRQRDVLTLPVSSIVGVRGPDWMTRAYFNARLNVVFSGMLQRFPKFRKSIMFWPEAASEKLLVLIAREIGDRGLPLAVFSLHNTSLFQGGNPYALTKDEARKVQQLTFSALKLCLDEGLLRRTNIMDVYEDFRDSRKSLVCQNANAA